MFKLNTILQFMLLLIVAWPGPRPVVHSHAACLTRTDAIPVLAVHMLMFHQDSRSLPDAPDDFHCHWVHFCSDFDKSLPVLVIDSTTSPAVEVADLYGTDKTITVYCLETNPPSANEGRAFSLADHISESAEGLAFQRRFCVWNC